MPKVIWLRPVRGRNGKTVERIECVLIAAAEDYCTVELPDGQRCAAKTADVKLAKADSNRHTSEPDCSVIALLFCHNTGHHEQYKGLLKADVGRRVSYVWSKAGSEMRTQHRPTPKHAASSSPPDGSR